MIFDIVLLTFLTSIPSILHTNSRMTLAQVNPLDIPELIYRVDWFLPLWEDFSRDNNWRQWSWLDTEP